jgi:predicted nucleotidyltransferase
MNKYQLKSKVDPAKVLSTYPEVQYYLNDILKTMDPNQVILFGSKARLGANSRSDCDFAIDSDKYVDEESIMGALDIVDLKDVDSNLMNQILMEGVLLYEKKKNE